MPLVDGMAEYSQVLSEHGWGVAESVIMGAALFGFLATYMLYVMSAPDGFVHPYGMVIGAIAGAYLLFVIYAYLRH